MSQTERQTDVDATTETQPTVTHRYWDEAGFRRRHANLVRIGDPVTPWETFVAEAGALVSAEAEYDAAMRDAQVALDAICPREDRRYPGWQRYATESAIAVYHLFTGTPNSVGPESFRFAESYGKSRRAPVARMRKRAEEFRIYTRKIRRTLAKHAPSVSQEKTGCM